MKALTIAPPSREARGLAARAAAEVARAFADAPVGAPAKPRWARSATISGSLVPEITKPPRSLPPRNRGTRKRFAAT